MTAKFDSCKDWSAEQIDECYRQIEIIAKDFDLDYYPNQIEIISSEQMLDAYAATGMPIYYSHWSFGKEFVKNQEMYKRGYMGLAYEIVINSNPCISYLMEENTMTMQALVMAHACFGHNNFFKNNHLFKQWTDADSIIDFLDYAKYKINEYEEKYGAKETEKVLDACHALRFHGVDRYKRPPARSKEQEEKLKLLRQEHEEKSFNDLWRTIPTSPKTQQEKRKRFLEEPEENVLYFIEKNAPNLPQWKRETIRIVRKLAQYFYPQMLTKVMNEGWATFWHYTILNEMYSRGLVTDGFMLEFLHSHSNVIYQPSYNQLNPYALGFAIFQDIKRICENPTKEDIEWFPEWAGNKDWIKTLKWAAYNFKDESFILQFLSPKVIRDFRLFHIIDDDKNPTYVVNAIHNESGYKTVREMLSLQHNINNLIPNIQVVDVDVWGDRHLQLEHYTTHRHSLEHDDALKTLYYLGYLWGYEVRMRTIGENNEERETYYMNPKSPSIKV